MATTNIKHKNVQSVVRSMSWFTWTPGHSVCYNDPSYVKKIEKRRYKFDYITTDVESGYCGNWSVDNNTNNIIPTNFADVRSKELLDALHASDFINCTQVMVYNDLVCVYSEEAIDGRGWGFR